VLTGLHLTGEQVRVPANFLNVDGAKVLQAAQLGGLEGVVAKKLTAPYRPGKRSADSWVKVPLIKTQEVLIIGWKPGEGRRLGGLGSLLLAVHDEHDRLTYAGKVGTGFTDRMLRDLEQDLKPFARTTPPVPDVPREDARHAHWVEPVLIGEVDFRSWTTDQRLRHASWRGLRNDRSAASVKRDMFVPRPPPVPEVKGAMVSPDGLWRVEVVSRGGVESFRVMQGDSVLEGLDLQGVEGLLAQRGIDLRSLRQVDPAA
jgi:bifunctional non-homologous end joining protein LigD